MQPQNVAVADSSGKLARRPSLVIFAGSPETAILLPAINNPSPTDALMEMTAGGAYKVTVGIIIPSSLSTAAMSASPPSSRTSAVVDQTSGDSATGGAVVCKRLSVQLKVYQVSRKQGPMPAMTSTSTHTGSASAIPKFPRSSSSPNFSLHYQRGHSFSTTSLPSLPFRPGQSSSQLETLGQRRPPSVVSSLSMPETRDVKERIIELQSIEHLLWEDEKTMSPGSYETTFTFFVPSNVPPSYSSPVAQGRDIFHVLSAVLEVEGQPRPIKVQRRISVRQCSWSIPPHLLSKASVRTIRMDDVRAVVSVTPQVSMDEEILVSLNLSSARSDLNLRFKSLQAFLMEKHVTRSKSFEEEVEVQVSPTLNYEPRRRMIRPNFEIPNSRSSSPGDSDGSDSSSPFDSDTVQFRFRPLEYSGHDAESADFVHQAPTPNVHIPRFASVTHFVRVTLRYSRQYKTGGSAQSSSNAVSRSEIESIHDVPVILIAPPSPLWTPMEIALSGKMKPERTTAGQPRQTERHPRTPPTMRLWGRLESLDSASGRLRRSNSSRSKSRRTPKLVPNDDAVSILSTASSLNLGFEVNEKSLLTYALKATHSQNPFSPRSESSKSPLASAPPSPLPGRFNSAPSPSRSQRLPTTGDDGRVDSALLSVESGKAPSRSLDLSKVTGNLVPSPARPHRRSPLGRPTSEDVSQTADVVSKSLSEQKAVSQAGANKQVAPINGEYHDGNHGSGIHVFSPRTSPADSPATNNAISAHPYHPAKTSLESYASDETAVSPLPHATFIPVETSKSKTEQEIPTPSALIGGFEGFPSGTKPRAVSLSTATLSSAHPARLPIHSILSAGPIPSFGSAGISANPIPPDLSGKSQSLEASTALPPSPSLSIEHNPPAKSPTVAAAAASTNRDTVPSTPASETAPNDRGGSWTWLKRGLSLRIGKKKV
ncbi:hypothetical protein DFJ73DRAFT_202918 [Zopfochytrium polystomum]|nr:hypothetical protein DFJ73DRAFT_202918 [Zopfochytrium polystomum]